MNSSRRIIAVLVGVAMGAGASGAAPIAMQANQASASKEAPPAKPPVPPPAKSPAMPAATPPVAPPVTPPPAPPSLDEALGLGGEKPKSDDDRARKEALDRSLSDAKPRDLLASAIEEMKRSGSLLSEHEAGLPTQRVQESAVHKLDELIAAAQRIKQNQQDQQQTSQSNGQQKKPGKQGQKPGGKPGDQPGAQPEPSEQQQARGGRDGKKPQPGDRKGGQAEANANEPPAPVDPTDVMAQFDETRSEWGRLPARVRDAVRQGMRDPMSASYRRMTQDYYRRMAEEPKH